MAAFFPAAAIAQTANPEATVGEVTVPEGYERQEAMLSADELLGEKVYDVTGQSIGEVGDLIFSVAESAASADPSTPAPATDVDTAESSTAPDAAGSTVTDGTTTATTTADAATDTDAPQTDDGTADVTAAPSTGDTAATDTATAPATGTETGTNDAAATTDPATDEATATPDTDRADTATADSGTDDGTAYTAPTPSDSATTATTTTDDTTARPAATAGSDAQTTVGEVTHAVLDIGGFLGIGEHRVAVPASDLAFYRNGDDTRVYLPWSREQLEAIPAYNADDPATWATSTLPADN